METCPRRVHQGAAPVCTTAQTPRRVHPGARPLLNGELCATRGGLLDEHDGRSPSLFRQGLPLRCTRAMRKGRFSPYDISIVFQTSAESVGDGVQLVPGMIGIPLLPLDDLDLLGGRIGGGFEADLAREALVLDERRYKDSHRVRRRSSQLGRVGAKKLGLVV